MTAKKVLNTLLVTLCALFAFGKFASVSAAEASYDVIALSNDNNWFHNEETEDQGEWSVADNKVMVNAFGGQYAMEGANYITNSASVLGSYEFETTIKINELNKVENPMVGIIPWYLDEDNYLMLQIKFTNAAHYLTTAEEKAEGYGIEQLVFGGKYNGEGKYISQTSQQENTTYDSAKVQALKTAKVNAKSSDGHKLKVKFEARSAMALSYTCTIYYNDVQIGQTDAFFYNAIAKNSCVGFMAQDVKAEFSNAKLTDLVATHKTPALARDWKENNGFTYRMLNGVDVWNFNEDDTITFKTNEVTSDGKTSEYNVNGTNIAGYDTNRGFTENPYREVDGLPQNYEVSATFKLNELDTARKFVQGYGLMPWYKDDINFVYVSFRRTKSLKVVNEIVLSGWIEYSSAEAGTNVYELPSDFDLTAEHTLTVQKKSNRFFVYLDGGEEPILSKQIKGTEINYYYGYDGYNADYTASKISSKAIYSAYDEIAVLDENETNWRVSGEDQKSWVFADSKISLAAKDDDNTLDSRSYILGVSDVCDTNMDVVVEASISQGKCYYSELMLSPYIFDEFNFAQIGLVWKSGKTYARVYASTFSDEDDEPIITRVEAEIASIDLSKPIKVVAKKIDTTLALYVNDELVYGFVVEGIVQNSVDFGLYLYNMDIEITNFGTLGYKKYEIVQVGDWTTSGMKYNEWTVDENGYLYGDATYTEEMKKDDFDGERNFAIKKNELATSGESYEITATIKAGKQSEAEDRLGVVMWYVDKDNFMLFYIDHWRSDSTVPRTTIYGKLNGETLPVTFNHGGWFPEGSTPIESAGGLNQTELSQVTQWHTVKVLKEGNTFTCYVDKTNVGYITYPVAGGLPSTDGKDVYSGLYTFNDEIIVRNYDVTTIGGYTQEKLPSPANNPINSSVKAPTLGTYNENVFVDEFELDGPAPEMDTTKPTVTITTNNTATAGDEITVSYTASDNVTSSANLVVSVTVTKDGIEVTLTNNKFTAEEGTYIIKVKATDEAGNDSSAELTLTVSAKEDVPSGDEPTVNPNPNPNPQPGGNDQSSGGCGGSIISSILGTLFLAGAVIVVSKRKQD